MTRSELSWTDKLRRLSNAKRVSSNVVERTLVELMPKSWPRAFYIQPDGINGTTCADIKGEPCEGCDGFKCVRAYIDISR